MKGKENAITVITKASVPLLVLALWPSTLQTLSFGLKKEAGAVDSRFVDESRRHREVEPTPMFHATPPPESASPWARPPKSEHSDAVENGNQWLRTPALVRDRQ